MSCYNYKRVGEPMRKILFLLLCLFTLTGCGNSVNLNDIDGIFDTFLKETTDLANNYAKGYKYYLPNGVKIISSDSYNDKISYNGYEYYLYVDIVSYYYKQVPSYNVDLNLYYSKELDYNGVKGYAEIEKVDDLYRIKVYYNYASVETYVDYDNIGQNLINICYILNSIKFNDAVVKISVGQDDYMLNEEVFDFYTPRKEGNFIDHINKYDEYVEVSDENNIGNEGNE